MSLHAEEVRAPDRWSARRFLRWGLGLFAGLAVLILLALAAIQVLLLQVPERRAEIQNWVNRTSGLELRLPNLSARWRLTGPELYATNVEVHAPQGGPKLAQARRVSIGIDLWRMVSRFELLAGRVQLIGPEVRLIRTAAGTVELEGQAQFKPRGAGHLDSDELPSGWLDVTDGRVVLTDARDGRTLVKLQGLSLKLERDRKALRITGTLDLPPALGASLAFGATARGRLDDAANLGWQATVRGRGLQLAAWQPVLGGRWQALHPEGAVSVLELSISKSPRSPLRLQAAAKFSGLGFDPVGRLPGVRGLEGEVESSEQSGKARLASRSFVFLMPWSFREPLPADVLSGEVSWKHVVPQTPQEEKEPQGWHIASRQFLVQNAHARATTDLDLTLPADGSSPVLQLHSRFQDVVIKEGWHYLPINRLGPKTLAWLDAAFLDGRVPAGELVFNGPMRKFPFRGGEGEFRVSFPVEGLKLHYGNGWPELQNLAADVEFHNAGLTGTVRSGQLSGLEIASGGSAQFADFKTGDLTVRGRAEGDLGQALEFLQHSPLGPKFGKIFMDLRGQGPVGADINLLLPVKHMADRKVNLLATFNRDRLSLAGTERVLQGLRGSLRVENKRIAGSGLTATYLNGPVRIDLAPEGNQRRGGVDNVVRVRAQTPAAALAQSLEAPQALGLDGTIDWRAVARVPVDADEETHKQTAPRRPIALRIDSSLRGTEIGLPAPLNKAAAETRPLRIDVQWSDPQTALVRASYGGLLRSQIQLGKEEEWRLTRGAVKLGGGEARLPDSDGLYIDGALDTFDLSAWLALRSDKPGKRPLSGYLRSVDVAVRDFGVYGFHFSDVKGRLTAGERAWVASVDAPRAHGTVLVPFDLQGPEPLVLNMVRLDLGEPRAGPGSKDKSGSDADPTRWPAVKVSVGDFSAWNKHFGALQAELLRVSAGLELKSLHAQATSFSLNGTGAWTVGAEGARSRLALKLESSDVLQTLQDLGYGASLTGKRGLVTLDLNWPGPPDSRLMARLSGTMSVEIENGQLLGVQPGAGRVFGLMSVATLRRRLALDFSDLTDKGLAFDNIRGDFDLKSGNAYTSNLLLKGPAAEIGIVGRTGLDARDYDQTAVVTGNLGSSLPVAGALAGGPAVGAALLVFSQIFKQPLKGIARGYYRITGSWDEPTIQRVEASEVKKTDSSLHEKEQSVTPEKAPAAPRLAGDTGGPSE